jgi:hypothetical protein
MSTPVSLMTSMMMIMIDAGRAVVLVAVVVVSPVKLRSVRD